MDTDYNPNTNDNVISIIRQPDGNYIGYTKKHGILINERAGDPATVLLQIITHA